MDVPFPISSYIDSSHVSFAVKYLDIFRLYLIFVKLKSILLYAYFNHSMRYRLKFTKSLVNILKTTLSKFGNVNS